MATYLVQAKVVPAGQEPVIVKRLVESKTKAGAVNHVASSTISAEVATTQDILDLGKAGVTLETAGEQAQS